MSEIPMDHVSPVKGRRVLDPMRGTPIGANEPVVWSSYWQRRLDDGDITRSPGPQQKEA